MRNALVRVTWLDPPPPPQSYMHPVARKKKPPHYINICFVAEMVNQHDIALVVFHATIPHLLDM